MRPDEGPAACLGYRCVRCRRSFTAWTGTLLQGPCSPPSELLAELLRALERVAQKRPNVASVHDPAGTHFPLNPGPTLPNHPYPVLPGMPCVPDS